jgi:ADP-heptose:LPS heptosyltransferase
MNTLIIHTGGIGDFLLTCPAIEQLAATETTTLAGHKERLQLAVEGGIAETANSLESIDFHTVFTDPSQKFLEFANRFDRAILWLRDDDNALKRAFDQTNIKCVDIHPGLPQKDWTDHASDYYIQCLDLPAAHPFRLEIEPQGEPLDIVIHPGSGSLAKNKPLEFFQEVANQYENEGRTVTWCLGPAEQERLDFHPKKMLEESSLVILAQRLATAKQYIGNDSGITHLAASLGVPTTAHFIFTDPAIWAPKGDHVTVIAQ